MTHTQAVSELRRQLQNAEATREQYQRVIDEMEDEMIAMHIAASFDVLRYAQCEATVAAYRAVLDLPKSNIRKRATVSPTLTNSEYQVAMKSQFPEPARPKRALTQLWEPCQDCGAEPSYLEYDFRCKNCGGRA